VGQCFTFGPWQVDAGCMKIRKDGNELDITKRQAEMIQFFAANPNRVVDRRELYRAVWKEDMTGLETRTVDMHIAKLRSKIEPDPADPVIIKTVRRAGYLYESQDTTSDRK
jgi:two-component system response regulator RegX3